MSEVNDNVTEIGESKEKNFAEVLKLAMSHATFENKDIGGAVFALLDSLASDQIYTEFEESDTTVSLMSDLVDAIKEEIDDIAGRVDEDDDENEEDEELGEDLDDVEIESIETRSENEDDDDDDDEDDLPDELGEVDEDDDDEIVEGAPKVE